MKQIETNIVNSFRLAKTDIIKTQKSVIEISRTQEKMLEMLDELKAEIAKMHKQINKNTNRKPVVKKVVKKVVKRVSKRKPTLFIAAKEGPKYHIESCPYAKNIKPKHKVTYKSHTTAKNEGKKPCICVK